MSAMKRQRLDRHQLDLKLKCASDAMVLVSSKLLSAATRSPSFADVLSKLDGENPNASSDAPMELAVPEDSASAWRLVWELVENPMPSSPKEPTWAALEAAITLADKYDITAALQACEACILSKVLKLFQRKAATHPTPAPNPYEHHPRPDPPATPWGFLTEPDGTRFDLHLPFLELLLKAHMHRAVAALAPVYVQVLYEGTSELRRMRRELNDLARNNTDMKDEDGWEHAMDHYGFTGTVYEFVFDDKQSKLRAREFELTRQVKAMRVAVRSHASNRSC